MVNGKWLMVRPIADFGSLIYDLDSIRVLSVLRCLSSAVRRPASRVWLRSRVYHVAPAAGQVATWLPTWRPTAFLRASLHVGKLLAPHNLVALDQFGDAFGQGPLRLEAGGFNLGVTDHVVALIGILADGRLHDREGGDLFFDFQA